MRCKSAIGAFLDVEILHVERIILDELAARFDVFAHQSGEDGVGFGDVFELYLEQGAAVGVHCGFPELRIAHLAEALVTLDLVVLLALFDDIGKEFAGRRFFDRLAGDASSAAGLLGFSLGFGVAGFFLLLS